MFLNVSEALSRPPIALAALEGARSVYELSSLPLSGWLLNQAPRGDGHPVIVLPGFLSCDRSTNLLRAFLSAKGFDARGWRLGRNLGPRTIGEDFRRLEVLIARTHIQLGCKVSLVGWSLGGVMAREIAKSMPDAVRQVITLGSPVSGLAECSNAYWTYRMLVGDPSETTAAAARRARPPRGVPTTSIFTKSDGIVAWKGCLEPKTRWTDNIEVRGSHCGLAFNPAVYYAVADRLALAEDRWRPFEREASSWRLRTYPSAGHLVAPVARRRPRAGARRQARRPSAQAAAAALAA